MVLQRQETIKIGTRGSDLALAQAYELKERIENAHPEHELIIEIEVISTKGDRVLDRPLSEIGGKGLFTEEIEAKLSDGDIDMAVHSAKDMPTVLPDGLELSCFLPREDVSDAFICEKYKSLDDLPKGAVIGSASLRRKALLLRLRPDLEVVTFRGNVQTRLKKLANGDVDATLLACAGLIRLGMEDVISAKFEINEFPPAPGQGAICIETRVNDPRVAAILAPVNDEKTRIQLSAERAFLRALDGSCRTPLAGFAKIENEKLTFHGMILTPDGATCHELVEHGNIGEAHDIGTSVANQLRETAGSAFFETWVS